MVDSTAERQADPTDPEQAILHQDCYRKVMFGEVADPLFPPHPGTPVSSEDELTRAAMEDPAAGMVQVAHPEPTFWRFITLLVCAVGALTVVFWWFR
jgi:hypothetical protein